MNRRQFIKKAVSSAAVVVLPLPSISPKIAIEPEVIVSTAGYLDNLVELYGIVRTPETVFSDMETDDELRRRCLDSIRSST